ncbi:MAG: DUF501 domain-containing protein [Actinobacteria bacterium]|nr:DUF501 domain-containing protein [Actinomycetota bacterium]
MAAEDNDHRSVLGGQLGRIPRGTWRVVAVCPFGLPAVIETAPYLDDDAPFPTLFYLTCPSAVEEVSRAEAASGVERFRRRLRDDPVLAASLDEVDQRCRERRHELAVGVPNVARVDNGAVLDRGVGGPVGGEKATCLHAYAATLVAARAGALGHDPPADGTLRDLDGLLSNVGPLWCGDARCASFLPGSPTPRAAIDVGTNSVRLLVGVVGGTVCVRTLVRRARVTRLGAGFERTGPLDPDAARRTAEAVVGFVKEARQLGAEIIDLVGTSASRDASDGPEFIARLGRELGIRARVASGPEEALLSYRGATLDLPGEDTVVIDVGGGSTELVRGVERSGALGPPTVGRTTEETAASAHAAPAVDAVSLDLGCVRGTAAWFLSDPPTPEERVAARLAAREAFQPFADRFGAPRPLAPPEPGAASRTHARLVGVAGTITTLACLILELGSYDPAVIHLRGFSRSELARQVDRLAALDPEERAALPCIQPGRAGVIVAGGEVLLGAMEALGWTEVTVSERDMLDGILLEAGR